MKILLIHPETPDTFWSFKHVLRFISKPAAVELAIIGCHFRLVANRP